VVVGCSRNKTSKYTSWVVNRSNNCLVVYMLSQGDNSKADY